MQNFPKNILNNFPFPPVFSPFLEKDIEKRTVIISSNHIDPTKSIEEKIDQEKRRRNQAYLALDYTLALNSYFDFFSFDTFQIAKESKYYTQQKNEKIVSSDYLLLSFFLTELKITEVLKEFGLTIDIMSELISSFSNKEEKEKKIGFFQHFLERFQDFLPFSFASSVFEEEIQYSLEVNKLFEKASLNAFYRFKTPLIGTEILFLTLLEEESKAQKILKKFLKTEGEWFALRYFLIKRIYNQENIIRNEINQNQHYFAYLLKTRLSDLEFEIAVKNKFLAQAVSSFRNNLISEVLKIDIFQVLQEEVYESIKLNRKRNNQIDRFSEVEEEKKEE